MTVETDNHKPHIVWSSPVERLVVVGMLVVVQLAVVISVTLLGYHRVLDRASITAILGGVAGGSGTAIVHKLSTRA